MIRAAWSIGIALAGTLLAGSVHAAQRPARNVFWPVGYMESIRGEVSRGAAPASTQGPLDWAGAERSIRMSGFSMNQSGSAMAVIKGKVYNVNDELPVYFEGRVYRFKIRKIDEKGLVLKRIEEEAPPAPSSPSTEGRKQP